ncbi:hypothetical protein HYH02_005567 [Chlamydomonas schloesseri]|nr:hypothetical protein HYH02_005567 [Chlamydomonas schloesseri]|eukprot:KAG2449418.1 hypothetical protein HYH02_005567 [Chlamydomonas schloesseri]
MDQVAEARPRSALLPPGKLDTSRKYSPPRRAPPPAKATVPSPKTISPSPLVAPVSLSPVPLPSPRAQPSQSGPPLAPREGNGIRLVGGSGSRGRLEVSSLDGWLNEYEEGAVAWRPVCNMVGFDDNDAQVMCELLGYTYGRLYYSDEVVRRAPNDTATDIDMPIENLDCSPNHAPPATEVVDPTASGGRRLLLHGAASSLRRDRALLSSAFRRGTVDIPADAPYRCEFYQRTETSCDYTGPLVGVECALQPFPPAPPPPPSPPSPPDAPPARDVLLKVYGNGPGTASGGDLESNLCVPPAADAEDPQAAADEYDMCRSSTRADMLITEPASGQQAFAALCAIDDDYDLALLVANTLCKQMVDYPSSRYSSYGGTVLPSIPIPEADPPADALPPVFVPSAYADKWATIIGGEPNPRYPALQQMDFTVGSSCASGRLFAYKCTYRSR